MNRSLILQPQQTSSTTGIPESTKNIITQQAASTAALLKPQMGIKKKKTVVKKVVRKRVISTMQSQT